MSSYPVYSAFHATLATWTTTPVYYENEFFDPPLDGSGAPLPFVYVEVFGDTFNQETTGSPGSNLWLEEGVTYLHVMVPSGAGTGTARQYVDDLIALFREVPLSTTGGELVMTQMSKGAGEPGKDFPNHWAQTATIHWHVRTVTRA